MRKILLVLLALSVLLGNFPAYAEADGEKLEFDVEAAGISKTGLHTADMLTDGDEGSFALVKDAKNAVLNVKLSERSDVSCVRIATSGFAAWQRVKAFKISSGDREFTVDVPETGAKTAWVEAEVDFADISGLNIEIAEVYPSTAAAAAIAEVEILGKAAKSDNAQPVRELVISQDFTIKASSGALGGWEYAPARAFDKNSQTIGGLADVANGYILFQFNTPTDVSKISFMYQVNNDWAVSKTVRFYTYNEQTKYRRKLTNPEPITDGVEYTLKNTAEWQSIDLNGDVYKGITHLLVRFTSGYISATNASWGGWKEMQLDGVPLSGRPTTEEIIATTLKSNTEILWDMGIVDAASPEEFMNKTPTRLDMAEAILKLNGEYDAAKNYVGTFNFSDADAENYNILSYIFAYKSFGITGDGNNNFMPYAPLDARACYKMLLSMLGYECGKDFLWGSQGELLYKLGIGDMLNEKEFSGKDMCNAIYEALTLCRKDGGQVMLDELHGKGLVPDSAWAAISDKQDRVSPVTDGAYEIPDTANRDGSFVFTYDEREHILKKEAFAYNTPFHYAGMYYGMLPESDARSKRAEFSAAMKKAGARSMRFPGGIPAHQYFIEGEKYAIELDKILKKNGVGFSGLYNSDDYNNAWYVDFYDFLDFCKENEIEPIFQTNPGFFVDKDGKVRQAYPCFGVKNTDAGLITVDELYDHDRIDEAVEAFAKNLDDILARGYSIESWEIGNEDNYRNYSSLLLTDLSNPLTEDFLEASVKYAREIKKRFPGAHITVPAGFPYEKLPAEDYALFDSITRHYPFGLWTIPPIAERDSAARLARTNEQNFVANYPKEKQRADSAEGKLSVDDTETMAWRYEGWDPSSLMHTFANALNTAHNWGELVFDSGFISVNVMHDLESPWFGHVLYDVSMDTGNRYFSWNRNVNYTVHKDDIPKSYVFKDTYYFNPASKAFEILGRHCGGRVLVNSETNVRRLTSGYASVDGDTVTFTVVNRLDTPNKVTISLPNIVIDAQKATAEVMQSDYLRAVLESEYKQYEQQICVRGNKADPGADAIELEIPQNAIMHFSVKLDKIIDTEAE